MNERHAVIVGGGISGLSAAFFLFRRAAQEHLPLKITVLEASNRFGGVLRTLTHANLRMEAGADAFYAGQNDATDLCRELGLREDVIEAAPCFRHFFGLKNKKPFPQKIPAFRDKNHLMQRQLSQGKSGHSSEKENRVKLF